MKKEVLNAVDSELIFLKNSESKRLTLSDYLLNMELRLVEARYLHVNPDGDYQVKMAIEAVREIAALAVEALGKFGAPMRTEIG